MTTLSPVTNGNGQVAEHVAVTLPDTSRAILPAAMLDVAACNDTVIVCPLAALACTGGVVAMVYDRLVQGAVQVTFPV